MNKLFISFLSFVPMVASADYLNDKWTNLVKEKQELISELEKCQKNTKGFKIAGLATLGVSAIGVGVNIGEAVKINKLEGEINQAQQRISNLDTEINKAKNTCGTKNCPGASNIANAAEPVCIKDEWKVLKCAEGYKEQDEHTCKRDGKEITYYDKCVVASAVPARAVATEEDWLAFLAGGEIVEDGCEGVEKPNNRFYKLESKASEKTEEPVCIDNDWWFKGNCGNGYFPMAEKIIDSKDVYVQNCTTDELVVREEKTSNALKMGLAIKGIKGQIIFDILGGAQVPDPKIGACKALDIPYAQIFAEYELFNRRSISKSTTNASKSVVEYLTKIGVQGADPECFVVGSSGNYGLNGCGTDHYLKIDNPQYLSSRVHPYGDGACIKGCTGVKFQYQVTLKALTNACKESLTADTGTDNTSSSFIITNNACITNEQLALDRCYEECKLLSMPDTYTPGLSQSECFLQLVAVSKDGMDCYCNPREEDKKEFLWRRGDLLSEKELKKKYGIDKINIK
ncbi:MAG: hypothetical protein R8M71_00805 [Alphaproteobacteria bacterium]|nr:hypothetical protein [Alphaproteobacteria bacterium]